MDVGLERANNEYAIIGVRPCQATSGGGSVPYITSCTTPGAAPGNAGAWELFYNVASGGGTPVDSDTTVDSVVVPNGTNVFVSVYFNANQRSVNFIATINGVTVINFTQSVAGSAYTEAEAQASWVYPQPASVTGPPVHTHITPVMPTNPSGDTRLTQFLDGRFTTQSGQRGTFKGPWTLVPVSGTSNGAAPGTAGGGTLIVEPAYLWTDSMTLNGMFGDAFGLWLRQNS
jgi:hypothetical protein